MGKTAPLFIISGGLLLIGSAVSFMRRVTFGPGGDTHNTNIPSRVANTEILPNISRPISNNSASFGNLFNSLFSFTGNSFVPGQSEIPIVLANHETFERSTLASAGKLGGVDRDLIEVMELANKISPLKFRITEGTRSFERQKELVASGASKTLNSKHLDGRAVDIFVTPPGNEEPWQFEHFQEVAKYVKLAANALGHKIIWGGDWPTFKDGPHFEIVKGESV